MRPALRGVIFDLDGTLVDSRLDFDLMRRELGIPGRQPVLEYVESLPEGDEKRRCWEILSQHEYRGAREAELMPGVAELLAILNQLGLKAAILTRNTRGPTALMLERLALRQFSPVLTREDAPPKPDPAGIVKICREWSCDPGAVIFVGDYRFDLLAGRRAGSKTILYAPKSLPPFADEADHVASCFLELASRFEAVAVERLGFRARR